MAARRSASGCDVVNMNWASDVSFTIDREQTAAGQTIEVTFEKLADEDGKRYWVADPAGGGALHGDGGEDPRSRTACDRCGSRRARRAPTRVRHADERRAEHDRAARRKLCGRVIRAPSRNSPHIWLARLRATSSPSASPARRARSRDRSRPGPRGAPGARPAGCRRARVSSASGVHELAAARLAVAETARAARGGPPPRPPATAIGRLDRSVGA